MWLWMRDVQSIFLVLKSRYLTFLYRNFNLLFDFLMMLLTFPSPESVWSISDPRYLMLHWPEMTVLLYVTSKLFLFLHFRFEPNRILSHLPGWRASLFSMSHLLQEFSSDDSFDEIAFGSLPDIAKGLTRLTGPKQILFLLVREVVLDHGSINWTFVYFYNKIVFWLTGHLFIVGKSLSS